MKKNFLFLLTTCLLLDAASAQNVGIGTNTPSEKLEVNGAIKIGVNSGLSAGTVRWNPATGDFEGYNGSSWLSFTNSRLPWGNYTVSEKSYSMLLLNKWTTAGGTNYYGEYLGNSLAYDNGYLLAGAPFDMDSNLNNAGSSRMFKKINGYWEPYYSLYSPTPQHDGWFGTQVAMRDNYIICGAPKEDVNGIIRQGRAYIFSWSDIGGNPVASLQASLSQSSGAIDDFYGGSVDINTDYAIVGAPTYGSTDAGKAYTYKRNGSSWTEMSPFFIPFIASGDNFGYAVAVNGQYAVVGAPKANINGQNDKGRVYIYKVNAANTGWDYITTLSPTNEPDSIYFGKSIYLRGDTLLVGAPGYAFPGNRTGKAFLYIRNGNSWILQATLFPPDRNMNDGFGNAVYFHNRHIIIGAKAARIGANNNQGKSYIFSYTGNGWEHESTLVSSDGRTEDGFGTGVILSGNEVMVSAPSVDFGVRTNNGRIYFFER